MSDLVAKKSRTTPSLKLYYFDIPGKGEPIRLACTYGNLPFEDIRLDRESFVSMKEKGELAFGQLPALSVGDDGTVLVQSAAIIRYIGKQCGLYPTGDDILAAKIDALLDSENDLFTGLTVSRYSSRYGFGHMTPEDVAAVRTSLNEEVLPRHLGNFEAILAASASGWLAGGETPSVADFALVPRLQWLVEPGQHDGISTSILDPYPKLRALIDKLLALPAIAAYYKK